MTDQEFFEHIYKVIEKVKKSSFSLTLEEKKKVMVTFHEQTGSNYAKAQKTISILTRKDEEGILKEAATVDDLKRLLNDLKYAATQWVNS